MRDGRTDWPEKARKLAGRFERAALDPDALNWASHNVGDYRAGLACSGGADSLCLLLLIWAHFPELRPKLTVLHFDHRLRGGASRADALFVEEVAIALGLAALIGRWDRPAADPVSEESARDARFTFFYREMKSIGTDILFLGHQRDDIVESQLMRLSRGSGTAGLAAPRPAGEFADGRVHLRPLLSLGGSEIRRALEDLGIPYRVDASNEGLDFYRNRIRLDVLPHWQRHSPFDIFAGAAASRKLFEEDNEALQKWLRELMPDPCRDIPLNLGPLAGKPRALLRRALRQWLAVERLTASFSKAAFENLLVAAEAGKPFRMSAGEGVFLEAKADGMIRKRKARSAAGGMFERPWPLPCRGAILLPGDAVLKADSFSLDSTARERIISGLVESRNEAFLAWQGEELRVRQWRSGDRFRPLGSPGSRKLQDIFVDMKIPEGERKFMPVVLLDEEIVWIPGAPPAEAFKIDSRTKSVVRLTYCCRRPA